MKMSQVTPILLFLLLQPLQASGKWAGGIILLPSVDVTVDGISTSHGPLQSGQEIASGKKQARIFAMGPSGKALMVLAESTKASLEGTASKGWVMNLNRGAVRVVRKSGAGTPVQIQASLKPVTLPKEGGIVVLRDDGAEVHPLGSTEDMQMFPADAPHAASQMGLPSPGLPLIEVSTSKDGGGPEGGLGGGTEVEGESKCIDSASTGPEGTDPTNDGNTGVEIDRTKTGIDLKVTW